VHGKTMGVLSVETNVHGRWSTVWSKRGQQHSSQSASWTHATVKLPSGTSQVRFKGTKGSSYTGDMSVDSIKLSGSSSGSSSGGYTKVSGRYCGSSDTISSMPRTKAQAEEACGADSSCVSISDPGCDGSGDYELCRSTKGEMSTVGSCLFLKPGAGAHSSSGSCTFESSVCGWTEYGKNAWTRGYATPSSGTGASRAHGGKWFMYLETSNGRQGDISYLVSPRLSSPRSMSFYYHMHGKSMGSLSCEANVHGQWSTVWMRSGQQHKSQSTSWTRADIGLPTGTTQVRFKGVKGSSYTGDMSIDTILTTGSSSPSVSSYSSKVSGRYCSSSDTISTHASTRAQAEAACSQDSSCKAISDPDCDGSGGWETCRSTTGSQSSQGTCMYLKPGTAGGACWSADTSKYEMCSGYKNVGYLCVGTHCAAMNPGGTPSSCATKAPAGFVVDASTGACVQASSVSSPGGSNNLASCNFEANTCGWTESGKNAWTRGSRTPSSGTGASNAHDGKYFMFLETSNGRTGDASYLVSPKLSSSARSMTFYYHMYGKTMGILSVEANVPGRALRWATLWSKHGQQHSTQTHSWSSGSVGLPAGIDRVRFKGTKGSSYTGDMAVDSVTFSTSAAPVPSTPPPPVQPPPPPVQPSRPKNAVFEIKNCGIPDVNGFYEVEKTYKGHTQYQKLGSRSGVYISYYKQCQHFRVRCPGTNNYNCVGCPDAGCWHIGVQSHSDKTFVSFANSRLGFPNTPPSGGWETHAWKCNMRGGAAPFNAVVQIDYYNRNPVCDYSNPTNEKNHGQTINMARVYSCPAGQLDLRTEFYDSKSHKWVKRVVTPPVLHWFGPGGH
jgi:hypothetical protein